MPMPKWGFEEISRYGERFHYQGGRKITLNFALAEGMPIDAAVLRGRYHPDVFLIKMTPVNPTYAAEANGVRSSFGNGGETERLIDMLRERGYEVILSLGAVEENRIGSNCGQYIKRHLGARRPVEGGYSSRLTEVRAR